jgi:hypothetical protein
LAVVFVEKAHEIVIGRILRLGIVEKAAQRVGIRVCRGVLSGILVEKATSEIVIGRILGIALVKKTTSKIVVGRILAWIFVEKTAQRIIIWRILTIVLVEKAVSSQKVIGGLVGI